MLSKCTSIPCFVREHGLRDVSLVGDAFLLVQVSCCTARPANWVLFAVRPGCWSQLWVLAVF